MCGTKEFNMTQTKKRFVPVILTPFSEAGAVDYKVLHNLTSFYIKAGAAGLFANCLSSEMYELTDEERLSTTKQVVKAAEGRVPVIATGTFEGNLMQKADFIKRIYDTGVEAVIVITGQMAEASESKAIFQDRMLRLLDMTEQIPLGFYECPIPYKRVLSATELAEFIKAGRIIYHKDTSLDIENIREKIAVSKGYDFGLYDAYAAHAVESLRAGAAGLSCVQGNYFPELIVWLCANYDKQALAREIQEVQQFLIDSMEVIHDAYPLAAKYYLKKSGFDISMFTRTSTSSFTKSHQLRVDQLYEAYQPIREKLGLIEAI